MKTLGIVCVVLIFNHVSQGYIRLDRLEHSVCYGSTSNNALSASCPVGEIIAVSDLVVGAKQQSTGCPQEVTLANFLYTPETCCRPTGSDCIARYSDSAERHRVACSGRKQCIATKVPSQTHDCSTTTYLTQTNFMSMYYYCVKETMLATMCSNSVVRGKDLFIRSHSYPEAIDSSSGILCECHVETSCDRIELVAVDMRLDGSVCTQSMIVEDGSGSNILGCSRNSRFDVTRMHTSNTNYMKIKLLNGLAIAGYPGGYFLVNVRSATGKSELTMRCGQEIQPITVSDCTEGTTWIIWLASGAAGTFFLIHVSMYFCVRKQIPWQRARARARNTDSKDTPSHSKQATKQKPGRFSLSIGKKKSKVGVDEPLGPGEATGKLLPDLVSKEGWVSPQPGGSSEKKESQRNTLLSPRAPTPLHKQPQKIHKHKKGEGIFNILQLKGFSPSERSRIPDPPEDTVSDAEGRLSPEGRAIERWASKGRLRQSQSDQLNQSADEKDLKGFETEKTIYYNSEQEEEKSDDDGRYDGRKTRMSGSRRPSEDRMFLDNVSYISHAELAETGEKGEDDGLMNVQINASHYQHDRYSPTSRLPKEDHYHTIDDQDRKQRTTLSYNSGQSGDVEDEYVDLEHIPPKNKINTISPASLHVSGREEELQAAFEGREPAQHEIDELYEQIGRHQKRRRVKKQQEKEDRPGTR